VVPPVGVFPPLGVVDDPAAAEVVLLAVEDPPLDPVCPALLTDVLVPLVEPPELPPPLSLLQPQPTTMLARATL
jgi:hypothetical protein